MGERICPFIGMLAAAACASLVHATPTPTTRIMAQSWQPLPGGDGRVYQAIEPCQIDELGRVSFPGRFVPVEGGTFDMYHQTDGTTSRTYAYDGQPIPDEHSFFTGFENNAKLSPSGNIAFNATFAVNPALGNQGIYYSDDGPLQTVAQSRSESPVGGENFSDVPDNFAVNDHGQVVFDFLHDFHRRMYIWENGTYREIGGPNNPPPLPGYRSMSNDVIGIDNSGFATVGALWYDATNTLRQAFLRTDGTTTQILAKERDQVVNGDYILGMRDPDPSSNHSGHISFADNNIAIIRADASGPHVFPLFRGDPLPSGDGEFMNRVFPKTAINNQGDVVFQSHINRWDVAGEEWGLFIGTPDSVEKIAYSGETVPGGNGRFTTQLNQIRYGINDHGQVAFLADITNTADTEGIFFWDPHYGLHKVVQRGDLIDGLEIGNLFLMSEADGFSSLNNRGEVAYWYVLENGSTGAAVWRLPTPGTLVVLGMSASLWTGRRRESLSCRSRRENRRRTRSIPAVIGVRTN